MNVRSITACTFALALVAMAGNVAVAQDRGRDYRDDRRSNMNERRDGHSFNDNDRRVTRDWYRQHQRRLGPGWRQRDRLSPSMQARLRRGQRLDPALRRQMHWMPIGLTRNYAPAPRGYRYAMIGGNVVVVDAGYNVWDSFSLDINFR